MTALCYAVLSFFLGLQGQACTLMLCRIYYDGKEKPEEVWAELADGSCRWRQTGSEIKVICLKVQLP